MKNNVASTSPSTMPADKPIILIVDDSRLMRVAIKKILKDDFSLIEAVDGEDAWSKLCDEPGIQGVFSDLSMPNLDGYGLLARVRGSSEEHIRSLPFVVITGKEGDLQGLLEEVRAHGATDLVGKPFKSEEIVERTKAFLTGRQAGTEVDEVEQVPAAEPEVAIVAESGMQLMETEVDSRLAAMDVPAPESVEIPDTDALTGLLNETSFIQTANRMIDIAHRQGTDMALLRMQIDNQSVSDEDHTRDAMVLTVADNLRTQMRNRHSAAHLGDGQFAILLAEENTDGAQAWAEHFLEVATKDIAGLCLSGGIGALQPETGLDELRKVAEQRMQVATAAGGQRVFHDDLITLETIAEEKRLAEEARRAAAEIAAREQAAAEARAAAELEAQLARQRAEEEAARIKAEQEARKKAEEEARLAAEQAERERIAQEEEARRCEEVRAAARKLAEENARLLQEEEEARLRFNSFQALFVRMAIPFMYLGNFLFRLNREEQIAALRKRLP